MICPFHILVYLAKALEASFAPDSYTAASDRLPTSPSSKDVGSKKGEIV